MKPWIFLIVSVLGMMATYYYREVLGPAMVAIVVFFGTNLLLAGVYYLQLREKEKHAIDNA